MNTLQIRIEDNKSYNRKKKWGAGTIKSIFFGIE
jgi:hypothetical protein